MLKWGGYLLPCNHERPHRRDVGRSELEAMDVIETDGLTHFEDGRKAQKPRNTDIHRN